MLAAGGAEGAGGAGQAGQAGGAGQAGQAGGAGWAGVVAGSALCAVYSGFPRSECKTPGCPSLPPPDPYPAPACSPDLPGQGPPPSGRRGCRSRPRARRNRAWEPPCH